MTTSQNAATQVGQATMEWRVHLAHGQTRRTLALLAMIIGACALAYAAFGHSLPVLVTGVALLSAVSEFLLPITFRLNANGATRRNGLSYTVLAWNDVRRCVVDPVGVRLSPLSRPSSLDAFRGVYLRLPADEADQRRLREILGVYCPHANHQEGPDAAD